MKSTSSAARVEYPDGELLPDEDLTDGHMNRVRGRMLVLEGGAGGWPVVESECTLARLSDRLAEVGYVSFRLVPIAAVAAAVGLLFAPLLLPRLGPPLWADWCRCAVFSAVAVPALLAGWLRWRSRFCPPRWEVVQYPGDRRGVMYRRLSGPAWHVRRLSDCQFSTSWFGRWFGLVWAAHTDHPPVLVPGALRSLFLSTPSLVVPDRPRTTREAVAVFTWCWVLGFALLRSFSDGFRGATGGDAEALLLVAVVPVGLFIYCELWLS